MYRNHRNKNFNSWNNQQKNKSQSYNQNILNRDTNQKKFEPTRMFFDEEQTKRNQAIAELKNKKIICSKCGNPITELSSALNHKKSGEPIHFECAMSEIEQQETLENNEKIAYIGQGRFGVLSYENIRDQRHFTIKKIIEWEDREEKASWREEISDLYSKVN